MRPKSLILLSLALGCGLVASLGINQVMSKGSPAAAPAQDTDAIYVCARDIPINEVLTQDSLKLEQWPKSKIPPDAIRKLDDAVGRRTQVELQKSDMLRGGKLLEKGALSGHASALITPGFRGMAVQVDAASTAGNLLKPGDRVDVLVFVQKNLSANVGETRTVTLLQDVKVFAVNATITNKSSDSESTLNARTVTLELLPEQCELVNMAKQLGQLTLSVRSPKDNGIKNPTAGTDAGALTKGFWDTVGVKTTPLVAAASSAMDNSMADQFKKVMQQISGGAKNAANASIAAPTEEEKSWQMVVYRGPELAQYAFDKDGKTAKSSPDSDSDASDEGAAADKD